MYVIMGGGGAQLERASERVANFSFYTVTHFEHHYAWLERTTHDAWRFTVHSIHDVLLDSYEFNVSATTGAHQGTHTV
jgi:hypothetical protein